MNTLGENESTTNLSVQAKEYVIDFRALFMELLDKLVIILLTVVIASLGTYLLLTTVLPLKYVSTTKIYILPDSETEVVSYSDLEAGSQLTTDYFEFFKGREVVEQTIEYFQLDCTYKQFCKRWLTLENPADTRILSISIRNKDPFLARNVAIYLRDTAIEAIEEGMGVEDVTIWEDANLPTEYPYSPILIAAIAGAVTFCLFAAIVIVRYLLVDKIVAADDVEKRLNMTVLGSITFEHFSKNKTVEAGKKSSDIQQPFQLPLRMGESFKSLRANLEFCGKDYRVIALTSSIPSEGKSTISFQLAYQLALSGKKTLFIDADMRKSMFAEKFAIAKERRQGLSEILAGKFTVDECLHNTTIDNLYILLSGNFPPNPAELLSSSAFPTLVAQLREQYDYVIVDTPPLASVIDSAIIGKECDGVIVVIGSDLVSRRVVSRVCQQLERANCKVLGAVVNKIKISNRTIYGTYGSNWHYYHSYGQYYK